MDAPRWYDPDMRARWIALWVVASCTDAGGVTLALDVPANDALDPFSLPIAEIALTVRAGDDVIYSATRENPERTEGIDFGRVPYGDALRFEVTAAAPSGRIVGYGRNDAPIDSPEGERVVVPVRVRRPFSYLAGATSLIAVDGTSEPGTAYTSERDLGFETTAVATTHDGNEIVVAAGNALVILSSADHSPIEPMPAPLPDTVGRLAVSGDGRWAVATHDTPETTGVSIVDLDVVRAGDEPRPTFVPTARPGEVAIAGDLAWILLDPLVGFSCAGESSVMTIDLTDPTAELPATPLDQRATRIAVDPASGAAYVVIACASEIVRIGEPGAAPEPFLQLAGASTVTIERDRLWANGHVDGEGAHITLASAPLAGGQATVLDLPTLEERAIATALAQQGQDGVIQMTADLASAYDLSVLPDGEHVAILVAAGYITDPAGDDGTGRPVVPKITLVSYEYQLVQLDTGLGAQRLRTWCDITWDPGALLDEFECARAPGQDTTDLPFVPDNLATLFGSP